MFLYFNGLRFFFEGGNQARDFNRAILRPKEARYFVQTNGFEIMIFEGRRRGHVGDAREGRALWDVKPM